MGNAVTAGEEGKTIVRTPSDLLPIMRAPGLGQTRKGLGVEIEMFLTDAKSGLRLPYEDKSDKPSVARVLHQMATNNKAWEPYGEKGKIYGLKQTLPGGDPNNSADTMHVCLEPGGQIECAFPARASLKQVEADIKGYMGELARAASQVGAKPVAAGYSPVPAPADLSSLVVGRSRYAAMWQHMQRADGLEDKFAPLANRSPREARRDPCAMDMAANTSALQITIQAETPTQEGEFHRLALGIMPVLTALGNNSPIRAGQLDKGESHRMENWNRYKPERSGNLPRLHGAQDTTLQFVTEVFNTPMMFNVVNGMYLPANGKTFADKAKAGRATVDDFTNHMSSRADDIRIKRAGVVELRQMDSSPDPAVNVGMTALVKGLFYDDAARQRALALVADNEQHQRDGMRYSVPRHGFRTFTGNGRQDLGELASDLISIAETALKKTGEAHYLQPLKKMLHQGNQAEVTRREILGTKPYDASQLTVVPTQMAAELYALRHLQQGDNTTPAINPKPQLS